MQCYNSNMSQLLLKECERNIGDCERDACARERALTDWSYEFRTDGRTRTEMAASACLPARCPQKLVSMCGDLKRSKEGRKGA